MTSPEQHDSLDQLPEAVVDEERKGLPIVRALVEADPAQVTGQEVIRVCRERLSPYKVPARVDVLEHLDRDENGKVLRAFLED